MEFPSSHLKNSSTSSEVLKIRDLSDIPQCQNMAQGRFMVGTTHESRLMRDKCKNTWSRRHSPNEAPQAPSNRLSPASRQKTWGDGLIGSKTHLSKGGGVLVMILNSIWWWGSNLGNLITPRSTVTRSSNVRCIR